MEGILKEINNKVKHKLSMLLSNIVPPKMPEFSIQDSKEAIFFIYLQNDKISFISYKDDKEGDEIIKVGMINDKFTFYPIKQDSIYFGEKFELQTSRFIESILNNKLNIIANKIYSDMEFFLDKIMEYEALYINKLDNMEIKLNLLDKTNIIYANDELYKKCSNEILEKLHYLTKTNIRDSHLNIFSIMYPDGINDIEHFMIQKTSLNANMLKNYYNKSNLSNPSLIEKIDIEIGNQTLEINYLIKNIYLKHSTKRQIYANSEVLIDSINGINMQPNDILYSNNEIKVIINKDSLIIKNLTNKNIDINEINSTFYINNSTQPFSQTQNTNIKINANTEISIDKKNVSIKNLTANNIQQYSIMHNIKLTYAIDDESKNLVGKSQYKLCDILNL